MGVEASLSSDLPRCRKRKGPLGLNTSMASIMEKRMKRRAGKK